MGFDILGLFKFVFIFGVLIFWVFGKEGLFGDIFGILLGEIFLVFELFFVKLFLVRVDVFKLMFLKLGLI